MAGHNGDDKNQRQQYEGSRLEASHNKFGLPSAHKWQSWFSECFVYLNVCQIYYVAGQTQYCPCIMPCLNQSITAYATLRCLRTTKIIIEYVFQLYRVSQMCHSRQNHGYAFANLHMPNFRLQIDRCHTYMVNNNKYRWNSEKLMIAMLHTYIHTGISLTCRMV